MYVELAEIRKSNNEKKPLNADKHHVAGQAGLACYSNDQWK